MKFIIQVALMAQFSGTTAKDPEQGLYKPAWTTSKNEVMLGWTKNQLKRYNVKPWYVTVSPDMIVGQIKLDKGKLSLESRTMLTAKGLKTETLYVERPNKKRKMPEQKPKKHTRTRQSYVPAGALRRPTHWLIRCSPLLFVLRSRTSRFCPTCSSQS